MMKPLQVSVSFFSTVVITSFCTENYFYSCLYTLMIIFGIMNHALERKQDNGKNIIHIIDTFLAHTAFVCILYDSYPNWFMMGGLFNTFVFFMLEYMYPKYDHIFHMMIHIHTIVSMNTYFIYIQE
jgi:hypothetical protein